MMQPTVDQKKQRAQRMIWTPLIGFDQQHDDRGVEAYYKTIGFRPDGISLFLFCPDIVHHHEGMEAERVLPPDNCNYYGHLCNEVRGIQPWTNYDLRTLVSGIEAQGTETYLGLMGVYSNAEVDHPSRYNAGHREWLADHPELVGTWTIGKASLHVLKRFRDGTYYEDYFLAKVRTVLHDYGFSGLHVSDNFCPPGSGGSAKNGDFSDDMMEQFVSHTGIVLPDEIAGELDESDLAAVKRRGTYIWNRHKQQWLSFLTWRWGTFWSKLCAGLHADGKKVMVNNAWCSEPFEAIYRYGIDYRSLHEAGVDYMAAESVATSVHAANERGEYRLYNYMTMPALMKAYNPDSKIICLNGVKDSTEEWDVIGHLPSAVEREVYALTNQYMYTAEGLQRAMDGFLVCLGDGLTENEWGWLRGRWDAALDEMPTRVLTPTLIWSDAALHALLPDYIAHKRWTLHKTVYELARAGAQCGAIARIDDMDAVTGPIFIPNIDLLPLVEQEQIARYDRGPVLCTSLASRSFQMPDGQEPDVVFDDPVAACTLRMAAYRLGYVDFADVTETLGDDDGSPDLKGDPRYVEDPGVWRDGLLYRKASTGFVTACAKLLRACYETSWTTSLEHPLLPLCLSDGRTRLLVGNDNRLQYRLPVLRTTEQVGQITNHSAFPALPAKLVDHAGKVILPRSDDSHLQHEASGFVAKIPPGGMTIFDVSTFPERG